MVTITEIPLHDSFVVLGHTFHSLQNVRDAVSIMAQSDRDSSGKRYITHEKPSNPIPGLYVGLVYEPYPCFDSSDYGYEDRKYWNFFFSRKPITEGIINRLADMQCLSDARYVHKNMDESATPALYWGGDSFYNISLATASK